MNKKRLGSICFVEKGNSPIQKTIPGVYPMVVTAEERLSSETYQFDGSAVCIPLVSSTGHGHASMKRIHFQEGKFALGNILCAVQTKDDNILLNKYLYIYLSYHKDDILVPLMTGSTNVTLTLKDIINIEIPVPPIAVQEEIVSRYEHIIETNLKAITAQRINYENNTLALKNVLITNKLSNAEMVRMDSVFNIEKGSLQSSKCVAGDYTFVTAAAEWKTHKEYTHECEALIYAVGAEGSLGRVHYINDKFISSDLCFILTAKREVVYRLYQNIFMLNRSTMVHDLATGTSKKAINIKNFSKYLIPYLDIDTQEDLYQVIEKINRLEEKISEIKDLENDLRFSYVAKILQDYNL
jgi:restriction endonuclease S subunit